MTGEPALVGRWPALHRAALALCLARAALSAAGPPLDFLFPAGGQQGTTLSVLAGGRFETWPVSVWSDDPGIVFRPGASNGQFQVEIAGAVPVGPHLVRLYHDQGASAPAQFVVGEFPERIVRPGDTNDAAAVLIDQFPTTVNGLIRPSTQTQTLHLTLPGACLLRARLCAVALDSPLPVTLELLSAASNRLALVEPPSGHDPDLAQPVGQAGDYLLRIVASTNAPVLSPGTVPDFAAVYRLTIGTEMLPPVAPIPAISSLLVRPDVIMWHPAIKVRPLALPGVTRGTIDPRGSEVDYGFNAQGQQRFFFRVRAASIGSTLVPTLQILDAERNPLAEASPGGDPELLWTAPADGYYLVAVLGAQGRGGAQAPFQLEAQAPQPFFRAVVPAHTFRIEPGGTNVITVALVRAPNAEMVLHAVALGLPVGVQAPPQAAPTETTKLRLVLTADPDAKPANQPFRISLIRVGQVPPQTDLARAELKGRYAPPGALLINETDQFWLTVLPKPPPAATR